jgi:hypothetical protein
MNNWDQLVKSLDATLGFPNGVTSTVKKVGQFYDAKKSEHVFVLQYRVKVQPGDRGAHQTCTESLLGAILADGRS